MARKILLADDSVTAQNMGRKILTDAGYEVITVNNGSSALKKISESRPDLIVVDVYMPGYSGLEVCQRVKEARETAEIPVLLTVGKLEPFKQDEARRVRADAFIIKPFEASELLAALNRLEDRIVVSSSASARESGRASRLEKFERFAETEPKYGDRDAGWKARIPIPATGSKLTDFDGQAEPDAQESLSKASFRDLLPAQPERVASPTTAGSIFERLRPADVPQDITADEIAALTAAAARVSVGKDFERLASEPSRRELEAEPFKGVSLQPKPAEPTPTWSAEAAQFSPPAIEPEAKIETNAHGPGDGSRPAQVLPGQQESSPVPSVSLTPTASPQFSLPAQADSAAPSHHGHASKGVTEQAIHEGGQSTPQSAQAATTCEGATMALGPCWIAEEVPLVAEESVMVLEHEMHKAFAAFAAADAARAYEAAPIDRDEEPIFALVAPPAIGEAVPGNENASSSATETSTVASIASEVVPAAGISKPPAPPFAPANLVAEESNHALAAFGGPDPFAGSKEPVQALAAAASAAPSASSMASDNRGSAENFPPEREAELAPATAATWANWKEIRESVPGAPPANSKTIEETTDPKQSKPVEVARESPEDDSLTAADPNLSVIVDSMLAELKPKLMAELAKKLERKKE